MSIRESLEPHALRLLKTVIRRTTYLTHAANDNTYRVSLCPIEEIFYAAAMEEWRDALRTTQGWDAALLTDVLNGQLPKAVQRTEALWERLGMRECAGFAHSFAEDFDVTQLIPKEQL